MRVELPWWGIPPRSGCPSRHRLRDSVAVRPERDTNFSRQHPSFQSALPSNGRRWPELPETGPKRPFCPERQAPPCTRQVRDTYETGTRQVRATHEPGTGAAQLHEEGLLAFGISASRCGKRTRVAVAQDPNLANYPVNTPTGVPICQPVCRSCLRTPAALTWPCA